MKNLFFIFLLFLGFNVNAQWFKPNESYGTVYNGGAFQKVLLMPSRCGAPSGSVQMPIYGAQAAICYDTCNSKLYIYNPHSTGWAEFTGSGGGSTPTLAQVVAAGNTTPDSIITGKHIVKTNVKGFLHSLQEWQRADGKVRMSLGDISSIDSSIALKVIGTRGLSEGVEIAMVQDEGGPNLRNYGGYFYITPTTSNLEWWSRTNDVDNKRFLINNVSGDVDIYNNLNISKELRVSDLTKIQKDQNGTTYLQVRNDNSGSAAAAQLTLTGNGGSASLGKYSTAVSPYKILTPNDIHLYSNVGHMNFLNDNASGKIQFAAKGSSSAHLTIGGDSTVEINGSLLINNGRAASGYVWTSTGTNGGGDWQPAASGADSSTFATRTYVKAQIDSIRDSLVVDQTNLYKTTVGKTTTFGLKDTLNISYLKSNSFKVDTTGTVTCLGCGAIGVGNSVSSSAGASTAIGEGGTIDENSEATTITNGFGNNAIGCNDCLVGGTTSSGFANGVIAIGNANSGNEELSITIGGSGNQTNGVASGTFAGQSLAANGLNTVVIGGHDITGDEDNTVYVPSFSITGDKLSITSGTDKSFETVTLSAGKIDVSNATVTADSKIIVTAQSCSNCGFYYISNISAGVGFRINSSNASDASTVSYLKIN